MELVRTQITMWRIVVACTCILHLVQGQRPGFAGRRPIGYPELTNRTTTESLGNRFGEGDATTQKLPLEALGDRDLVERLSKLPLDKQPFWLLNWRALESHRSKPQTYPQKPNSFIDPAASIAEPTHRTTTVEVLSNKHGETTDSKPSNNSDSAKPKIITKSAEPLDKKMIDAVKTRKAKAGRTDDSYFNGMKYEPQPDYDERNHFFGHDYGFGSFEDSRETLK